MFDLIVKARRTTTRRDVVPLVASWAVHVLVPGASDLRSKPCDGRGPYRRRRSSLRELPPAVETADAGDDVRDFDTFDGVAGGIAGGVPGGLIGGTSALLT